MAAKKAASQEFRFAAKIVRAGTLYCIDVPASMSRAVGVRGYVAIVGTVNDVPIRGSLAPKGGGRHLVMLNADLRRQARASLGDRVDVRLRVDRDPPVLATPEDLAVALREEDALEAFLGMPRGRRNHIILWLEKAVHDETRVKRIVRIVEISLGKRERRLDRVSARSARRPS